MSDPEITNRMGFHKGTPDTLPRHAEARKRFIDLASWVKTTCPPGREAALAQTALQEALMWCNASIAINLAPLVEE